MRDEDYPALFRSSDTASLSAQTLYLRLVKTELILLVAVALLSSFNISTYPSDPWHLLFSIIPYSVPILMIISLTIWFAIRIRNPHAIWFDARSLSETTKRATWYYMMGITTANGDKEADENFLKELDDIRGRLLHLAEHLAAHIVDGEEITERMREVRNWPLNQRLEFFNLYRLDHQRQWYGRKASLNSDRETYWFWGILAVQALTVIVAWLWVNNPTPFKPVGALAALAAVFIGWSQIKRYGELARAYNIAANDLNKLRALANHVHSEDDFSRFVNDVEDAISREHSMWWLKRSGN